MTSLKDFVGIKYKLAKSENFDEFMKALGVGMVVRKMGNAVSPVIELTESDGVYTLKSSSTFKNTVTTFKLDEEFEEETPDGRKVKSVVTADGPNKIVQTQKGDKETIIIREFTPEECNMTLKVESIECIRNYKKVD